MKKIEGGITAAKGFQAAGGAAGIKKQGVKDMALVYSEVPCVAAGTLSLIHICSSRLLRSQRSLSATE